jgi:phenylacetate-CoA ligase
MNYGSNKQRSVYFAAPQLIKEAISTVYGMQQRRARYGKSFREALVLLGTTEYQSNDELRERQCWQAVAFVDKGLKETPYYRNHPEYNARWQTHDISQLPVLGKEQVRSQVSEFYSDQHLATPHRWQHTSGTTGKSLTFPVALSCFQREYAFRAFHYSWAGVDILTREPVAFCAGHPVAHHDCTRPPFWTHDHANNILYLSSYHLAQANLPAYCKELDRFTPIMLSGYPSSIYLLALAYRRYGEGRMKLRGVFTTSETVFPHQRALIEEVFGCKVFDAYGNSEMCAYAMQCEFGEYHLKLEHSYVEVLGEGDQPVLPGETGRLVTTAYGNAAFPLVRYEIGDLVTVSLNQKSLCGRSGLILDSVVGRVEDYVVTADRRLVGRLDHIFKDTRAVVEAQIVQERIGEVTLRIVKSNDYRVHDEEEILHEAHLRLGTGMQVLFEYVDAIPRTGNGKFRFVVSTFDQQPLLDQLTEQSLSLHL